MKTKTAAFWLVMLVLLGVGSASATSGQGQPRSRLDFVAQRGEIRICTTGDYRPFTYRDAAGQWSGIDVDLAGDLAKRLGVRLTLVPTTWKTLVDDLGANCDLAMGGISVTLDRAKRAFFTQPYVVDGKTPITRCENAQRFQTLEQIDQPGVRAVVNPGGTNEQFARDNLHQATIVPHPDNNTIFDEIIAGRADLMITDASETKWQAKQHPELCAVHPEQPFTFAEKAYLLPRGDVVFQQWVQQWLHLALNDGTYSRIAKPWLG
jgi:cyclohexadienyl dehydratase